MASKEKVLVQETTEEEVEASSSGAAALFPLTFNLYYEKASFTKTTFHLGEHKAQPIMTVVLSSSLRRNKVTLHSGVDTSSRVLGEATNTFAHLDVAIPPPPETVRSSVNERLSVHWKTATFAMQVGPTNRLEREQFEWRQSHGKETHDLDKHGWGWKLVRLRSDEDTLRAGGKRRDRQAGETSDGKEVVAVCTASSKASLTKWASFRFMGSGASGALGESWEVMAVLTALGLWQMTEV